MTGCKRTQSPSSSEIRAKPKDGVSEKAEDKNESLRNNFSPPQRFWLGTRKNHQENEKPADKSSSQFQISFVRCEKLLLWLSSSPIDCSVHCPTVYVSLFVLDQLQLPPPHLGSNAPEFTLDGLGPHLAQFQLPGRIIPQQPSEEQLMQRQFQNLMVCPHFHSTK